MSTTTSTTTTDPSATSSTPSTAAVILPPTISLPTNPTSNPAPNSDASQSTPPGPAANAPDLSMITPELRARFLEEMQRKKPSEDDVALWNKHSQDLLCTYCSNARISRCIPADGVKSVRCRPCNERRGTCSKVRDEYHFRVKRTLKIDDAVFQSLYESTGSAHHTIIRRNGKGGSGQRQNTEGDSISMSGSDPSQLPVRLRRRRSGTTGDSVDQAGLKFETNKSPTSRRKSKSKVNSSQDPDDDDGDGITSDASSDLSSLCDCDHEHKLALALEDVKRLELELASAKSTAPSSSSTTDSSALPRTAQNELSRTKSAKEELEKKLEATTQTLEKVLGQVSPLTAEAVRIRKENDDFKKKLRELEGIKAKYLELAMAGKDPKNGNPDEAKEALSRALERAEKAEQEADRVLDLKEKNVELSEELKRVTEALAKSEAECKGLKEANVAQAERERENAASEVGEVQYHNDKLNAMVLLLKGQLSRATIALKEATEQLSQSPQLRAQASQAQSQSEKLKAIVEKLEQEIVGLKKGNCKLTEELERERRKGKDAEKEQETENRTGDVTMNELGDENLASENPSFSTPVSSSPPPGNTSTPSKPAPSQLQPQSQSQAEAQPESQPDPRPQPQPNADRVDIDITHPSISIPDTITIISSSSTTSPPPPTFSTESSELSQLKSTNSTLQSTISDLQAAGFKLQSDIDALKMSNEELSDRLVSFKTQTNEVINLKVANMELKVKLGRITKEKEGQAAAAQGEEGLAADLKRKLKDTEAEVKSLSLELRKIDKEREKWERYREKLEKDKEKDLEKIRELKKSLDEVEGKLARAVREVKELTAETEKERRRDVRERGSYSQYTSRDRGRRLVDDEEDREERNSPYSSSSSTQVQAQGRTTRHTSVELEEATKEIGRLKDDLEYLQNHNSFLRSRLETRDIEHAVFLQKDVVEHTNIHLLNRMVLQAKTDFASRRITRAQIVETCDTISGQLLQVATRRLERLEGSGGERVGFNGIMDLMDTASSASTSGSRWQGPVQTQHNLSSPSGSRLTRRHPGEEDAYRNSGVDSQEEDVSEPPPKRRRFP